MVNISTSEIGSSRALQFKHSVLCTLLSFAISLCDFELFSVDRDFHFTPRFRLCHKYKQMLIIPQEKLSAQGAGWKLFTELQGKSSGKFLPD
jgi:hypothetical protein